MVPTVLDMLGLPIPAEVQGVSHAEWFRGGDPAPARKQVFLEKNFHDIYDPLRAVRDRELKFIRNFEQRPLLPLPGDLESSPTRRGYGDAHLAHRPDEELYDLRQDPWEEHNVADDPAYAEERARLAACLSAWQAETGDPLSAGPLTGPPWPRQPRYGALVEAEGGPWAR